MISLTDPARFGGDPADAFTAVVPSLPGYGLSFKQGQRRFGAEEIADCVAVLMRDTLGYSKFGARGGDWGRAEPRASAMRTPTGSWAFISIYCPRSGATWSGPSDPSPEGAAVFRRTRSLAKGRDRISMDPGHQAADLGVCTNRLAGWLAAWIVEKFRTWPDCGDDVESVFSRDQLLANISFYWFTGAIGSSFWPRRVTQSACPQDMRHSRAKSCGRRGRSRRAPTRISGAGPICRAAAISRRWSSPRRSPMKYRPSFGHCAAESSRY